MKKNSGRNPRLDSAGVLPLNLKNFVISIDDCVCFSTPGKSPSEMTAKEALNAREVPGAREWVNALVAQGHYVCFFTSRPQRLKSATSRWLKSKGFKFDSLLMDKPDALKYHYIDDRHVQATTFVGRFTPLVRKERRIQVFG
ncbi:MAG: phosphoheptose isomerase [Nitrososphaerota archaeon]|nr:phosphoheptose isomerase [Nitrososphaerota archaeon]